MKENINEFGGLGNVRNKCVKKEFAVEKKSDSKPSTNKANKVRAYSLLWR